MDLSDLSLGKWFLDTIIRDLMKFFRLLGDPSRSGKWLPAEPLSTDNVEIDAREFTKGKPYYGPSPCRVPIAQQGIPTEFTLAAFDMPIVSRRLGSILDSICPGAIQHFPVTVGECCSTYEILNVTTVAHCIDETRSDIMKWKPEDRRPEKVGMYRMVTNLTINPDRAGSNHIFRLGGWEIALVVSDDVKKAIEGTRDLGIVFGAVC
jgi:hypothetical protein